MLRPATPLLVILFASFVLLLISTLSTPIIKGIVLAHCLDVDFGVFGYCSQSQGCQFRLGYGTNQLFGSDQQSGCINFSSDGHHSLSSLLIVHPIACLLTLILLLLSVAAHFHSPAHSSRFLLAMLILTLPTLLITLLAFLADILLFVRYLKWAGWIVLASVILIVVSGVFLCAMRRTLVSRKARKRRIAENAEMSGASFYQRQAENDRLMAAAPPLSTESKMPLVTGSPRADNLPPHHTFSSGPRNSGDESRPVNGLPNTGGGRTPISPIGDENLAYGGQRNGLQNQPPRPMPVDGFSPSSPSGPPGPPGSGRMPPNGYGGRGTYPPPRGRGVYLGRGGGGVRGGFRGGPLPPGGSRGRGYGLPPRGRGGYPGQMMTSAAGGAIIGAATNRQPPPGYLSNGAPTPGPVLSMPYSQQAAHLQPHGEPASPSNYDGTTSNIGNAPFEAYGAPGEQGGVGARYEQHDYRHDDGLARAESPPPLQYDPSHDPMNNPNWPLANDVVAAGAPPLTHETVTTSPTAHEPPNQAGYIAPRSQWAQNPSSSVPPGHSRNRGQSVASNSSNYVEDVDPRFVDEAAPRIPASLQPAQQPRPAADAAPDGLQRTGSMDDLPAGARSPAESEQSHFTSVSQRPINPNWQPGGPGAVGSFAPAGPSRKNQQQARQDMLLANNPDFEIPGAGAPRGPPMRPGYGAGRGGASMGGVPRSPVGPSSLNVGDDGRYPSPAAPQGSIREV